MPVLVAGRLLGRAKGRIRPVNLGSMTTSTTLQGLVGRRMEWLVADDFFAWRALDRDLAGTRECYP